MLQAGCCSLPVDVLRTATSEVPNSSLEEGRGWICLPRTDDAAPQGVRAVGDAECSLPVALSWEACAADKDHGVTPLHTLV